MGGEKGSVGCSNVGEGFLIYLSTCDRGTSEKGEGIPALETAVALSSYAKAMISSAAGNLCAFWFQVLNRYPLLPQKQNSFKKILQPSDTVQGI